MSSFDEEEKDVSGVFASLRVTPSVEARERAFARLQQEFAVRESEQPVAPRRHYARWAAAAAVVLAVYAGWTWHALRGAPAVVVAQVEALDGVVDTHDGSLFGGSARLAIRAAVSTGHDLDVHAGAGALLRLSPDLTVRLAENTRVHFNAPDELTLATGQVFIDATPGSRSPLRILTPSGEVTHLGTQYQVRVGQHEVEVAVREGRAQLKAPNLTTVTEAGHWLLRRDAGTALTGELAADDVRFQWIGTLPTAFKLEGATLASFLEWFQRETGVTTVYSDGIDAGKFAQVQLKGSIESLDPFEALSYVLATADLAWHREGAKVIIEKRQAGNG